jgi:hypothetical protein
VAVAVAAGGLAAGGEQLATARKAKFEFRNPNFEIRRASGSVGANYIEANDSLAPFSARANDPFCTLPFSDFEFVSDFVLCLSRKEAQP